MDDRQTNQSLMMAVHTKKRLDEAAQRMETNSNRLLARADQIGVVVENTLDKHTSLLRDTAAEEVRKGTQEGINEFNTRLDALLKQMEDFSSFSGLAQARLEKASKSILAKAGYGLLAVLVLTAIILSGLIFYYKGVISEYRMEAELLKKYQQSAIFTCGDNLCVKTQKTPAEFRKQGLLLVAPKN